MTDSNLTFYIGVLAGSIFFIDGWGPSEKDKSFLESRRFRGLSIMVSGGVIAPVLDYVSKNERPEFFLGYLKGSIFGWLFVFLLGLVIYLFWKSTKDKNADSFLYKAGEFAYSVLDFIYLGISENPHLDAKRKRDLAEFNIKSEDQLNRLKDSLKQITPDNIKESSSGLAEFNKQLKSTKTEAEYTFEDWYLKGLSAFDKNEFEKTIAYMKNALEKNAWHKDSPNAYLYMGLSYERLELYDKGIVQYDKIFSDYPGYEFIYLIHYNKGVLFGDLGKFPEAIEEYDRSIALNSKYVNSWVNKANALVELNRYDEVLQTSEQAIRLDEQNGVAWHIKSLALVRLKKYREALVACNKALELQPGYAPSIYNRASIHANLEEKEKMLDDLKKAIELVPGNKEYVKTDAEFRNYWKDEDFLKLVS